MELLVSVRSRAEVEPALKGGADIIDAKEPGRGSLGAVSPAVLAEIVARIPPDQALSVALGDFADPAAVEEEITSVSISPRLAPLYFKLGFAGVIARKRLETMIARAVAAAERHQASPRIVVVAYADSARAGGTLPEALRDIAVTQGAAGVLLDTSAKDGRGLLGWMDQATLERWVIRGKEAAVLTALAGELKLEDIALIGRVDPDVVGFRGAACDGGRDGRVNASRVQALREQVGPGSGSIQGSRFS
jgi:(5-formylfuran-3-yl)methyl phosphate synthase